MKSGAAIRLGLRSLRGGLKGFRVFIACIALGVAAIAGIGSFSSALINGLQQQGAAILGADLSLQRIHQPPTAEERAIMARHGTLALLATTRAMARTPAGDATLAEVKAVDAAAYPLFGTLETEPAGGPSLLADGGVLVETALMARLNLALGDRLNVGDATLTVRGIIRQEPDRLAGGVGFGPRLMMSLESLQKTGLIQPGSLTKWHAQIRVPAEAQSDDALKASEDSLKAALPQGGYEFRSRLTASPQMERQVQRFTQFLTLVGLTALFIGGVGVASAVANHLDRRRDDIATLKALGATGPFITLMALSEILAFALIGIVLGLIIGAALPFVLTALIGPLIPLPLAPSFSPASLAIAGGYGLLVALGFSILPLARARLITVAALFRDTVTPKRFRPAPVDWLLLVSVFALLALLAWATAHDQRLALAFIAAAAAMFATLALLGRLAVALAARLPRPKSAMGRMMLANLHRPGNPTASVVMALGLGLTLVVMLVLADASVRRQITAVLPQKAPSFFFADIPARQGDEFAAFITARAPDAAVQKVPMLRGRIVAVNGVPAEQINAPESAAWALSGDRGITYADAPPEGSSVVKGEWWPKDHTGSNLVSLDERIAKGLGLDIGDSISVNVLGRTLEARIANLRRIQWESMGINFVLVFSPNMFRGAPATALATVALPSATSEQEIALVKAVAGAFPMVTSVRVKEALAAVDDISRQIAFAVRLASLVTLLAATLVLGGALSAGLRARIHDAVVLKTLGATRNWLLGVQLGELALLALVSALVALLVGTLAAYALTALILRIGFEFSIVAALAAIGIALLVTLVIGLGGVWSALGAKPARVLKEL